MTFPLSAALLFTRGAGRQGDRGGGGVVVYLQSFPVPFSILSSLIPPLTNSTISDQSDFELHRHVSSFSQALIITFRYTSLGITTHHRYMTCRVIYSMPSFIHPALIHLSRNLYHPETNPTQVGNPPGPPKCDDYIH